MNSEMPTTLPVTRAPTNDGPHGSASKQLLQEQGFSFNWELEELGAGRAPLADLDLCGIYVIAFETGEWYVGRSVDFLRRLGEHRRNHPDIARLYFKPVAPDLLTPEEVRLVALLETSWGWPLRNLQYGNVPRPETALHEIVPRTDLEAWVSDPDLDLGPGAPSDLSEQVRKTQRSNAELASHPLASGTRSALLTYVSDLLPVPLSTEMRYWSLTCMPGGRLTILARVNIWWQEVFVLLDDDGRLTAAFQVSRTALVRPRLAFLLFRLRNPAAHLIEHAYSSGGGDQLRVVVRGQKAINRLLQDSHLRRAARHLNHHLMSKGPVNAGIAHPHNAAFVRELALAEGGPDPQGAGPRRTTPSS